MTLQFTATTNRLKFAPVDGRRTFYLSVDLWLFAFWVQRWDAERSTSPRQPKRLWFKSRDGLMAWTFGVRSRYTFRNPLVRRVDT